MKLTAGREVTAAILITVTTVLAHFHMKGHVHIAETQTQNQVYQNNKLKIHTDV